VTRVFTCFPRPLQVTLSVRGVPILFSAKLHPCNLASHSAKVLTALKIINVWLYKSFNLHSGSTPTSRWRYCEQINKVTRTKPLRQFLMSTSSQHYYPSHRDPMQLSSSDQWVHCLAKATSHSGLRKKTFPLYPNYTATTESSPTDGGDDGNRDFSFLLVSPLANANMPQEFASELIQVPVPTICTNRKYLYNFCVTTCFGRYLLAIIR
jgi:hypothetical protein